MVKVAKFGGSSLEGRNEFERVIDIVGNDDDLRYVVDSAPKGVTNLLIKAYEGDSGAVSDVKGRLSEILSDSPVLLNELLATLDIRLGQGHRATVESFGDYASARIKVELMNKRGMDAVFCEPLKIGLLAKTDNGFVEPDFSSYSALGKNLSGINGRRCVIPGFYLYDSSGELVTFPRNGSDISGAVVANAVDADIYENWTDVDGLKRADPRIVPYAETIDEITFREARELANLNFKLQEECFLPLDEKMIPLHVRNTFNPKGRGTFVTGMRLVPRDESIVGVSAKGGFVSLNLYKLLMNREVGFGKKVFSVLEEEGICYEHSPSGNDTMSLVIHESYLAGRGKLNQLSRKLMSRCGLVQRPFCGRYMAKVGVAGLGMQNYSDVDLRVLSALEQAGIERVFSEKSSRESNYFVTVDEKRADDSVKAIYDEFFGGK